MQTDYVFVTNNNDFVHTDLFDGVEYTFPPKEKVPVPAVAATHMLGFNLKDKTEVLVRLGWAMTYDVVHRTYTENPDGVKRLAKFVFTKSVMVEAKGDPKGDSGGEQRTALV